MQDRERIFYRSPQDIAGQASQLVLPSEERLRPLIEVGIFDVMDEKVGKLREKVPDVVVTHPYMKRTDEGDDVVVMGARWGFQDGPNGERSCSVFTVEHKKTPETDSAGNIIFRTGTYYSATIPVEGMSLSLAKSEIQTAINIPARHVWTEPL